MFADGAFSLVPFGERIWTLPSRDGRMVAVVVPSHQTISTVNPPRACSPRTSPCFHEVGKAKFVSVALQEPLGDRGCRFEVCIDLEDALITGPLCAQQLALAVVL